MNTKLIAYIVLLILTIIVILIFLIHNKTELFTNPIVNLPANDIHFIKDDNQSLIDVPIFNYKLHINNIIPTQTEPIQSLDPKQTDPIQSPYSMQNLIKPTNALKSKTIQDLIKMHQPTQPLIKTQTQTQTQIQLNGQEQVAIIKYLSVFQHKPFNAYIGLGQYAIITEQPFDDINSAISSVLDKKCLIYLTSNPILPVGYDLIWTSDLNTDGKIFSIWHPISPAGCIALGDVIVMGTDQPSMNLITCFPITMLQHTALSNGIIWNSINDMGKACYCWGSGNIDTFRATNIYDSKMNELQSVYNLPGDLLLNNTYNALPTISNSITSGVQI